MQLGFAAIILSSILVSTSCQPEPGTPSSAQSANASMAKSTAKNADQMLTADGTVSIDVLAPCSVDGQVGCITTDQFKAADTSNVGPDNLTLGTVVAGVHGKTVPATEICTYRGQQNCIVAAPFLVGPPCSSGDYGCFLPPPDQILQSFSDHIPVLVRTTGHDQTGNGSTDQPFATPQRAFEFALKGDGSFVIDIGEGLFPKIDLQLAGATNWPSRIKIRGAGAGVSKIAGIDARGANMTQASEIPSNGKNLSITSNNTINLGKIDARAGQVCCGTKSRAGQPGSLEFWNVVADDIQIDGNRAASPIPYASSDGGALTATNSTLGEIFANGVTDTSDGQISNGGIIKLTSSAVGVIHANGGSRLAIGCGGHGGRVYLKDSTLAGAKISGGSGHDEKGEMCDGQPGMVRGSRP